MISDDSDATSDAIYKADKKLADIITTQNLFNINKIILDLFKKHPGLDNQTDLFNVFEKRCFGFQLSGTWWRRWIII
jgi:hypothetical protein